MRAAPACGGRLRRFWSRQAERFAGRIGIHAERLRAALQPRGAESEHRLLRRVEVIDEHVEVKLLGKGGVWPLRRRVVRHLLKQQWLLAVVADHRHAIALERYRLAEQRGVE